MTQVAIYKTSKNFIIDGGPCKEKTVAFEFTMYILSSDRDCKFLVQFLFPS